MHCKGQISILVVSLIVSLTSFAQVRDVAVLGIANITRSSMGESISGVNIGLQQQQSSRGAAGVSIEYEQWWGNNGAAIGYAISPTDSKLVSQAGRDQWAITRNQFEMSWMRRLRTGRIEPYVEGGLAVMVLNGGFMSGLDRQFAFAPGIGTDVRISSHLAFRYGLNVDFLRASNFSDRTYRGSRTVLWQPKFGLVWTFGSGRTRPRVVKLTQTMKPHPTGRE